MVKELVEREEALQEGMYFGEWLLSAQGLAKQSTTECFPCLMLGTTCWWEGQGRLVVTWTGPWRMVVQGEHVCTVEDLVTEQRFQVHPARRIPYSNASSDVAEELKGVIAPIRGQGELRMADVMNMGR